jgi:hypothetical protein
MYDGNTKALVVNPLNRYLLRKGDLGRESSRIELNLS